MIEAYPEEPRNLPSHGLEAAGQRCTCPSDAVFDICPRLAGMLFDCQVVTYALCGNEPGYAGTEYIWLGLGLCGEFKPLPGADGTGPSESLTGMYEGCNPGDMDGSCEATYPGRAGDGPSPTTLLCIDMCFDGSVM